MKIIEYGHPIDGIPYPVEIWNAKFHMWDDSIEELTHAIYAESEDGAIEAAKDFMLDTVHASDMNEEEQAESIDYYSSNAALCEQDKNNYRRDVAGTFRVYAVSIPYADLIGEGEEAYTESPYTEYEEYEEWNALKGD